MSFSNFILHPRSLTLIILVALMAACDDKPAPTPGGASPRPGAPGAAKAGTEPRSSSVMGTTISEVRALELAKAMAESKQVNLDLFNAPTTRFDSPHKEWIVSYTMKPPVKPGGHFMVVIDEAGVARFVAGK
jgi:hypothetical protein